MGGICIESTAGVTEPGTSSPFLSSRRERGLIFIQGSKAILRKIKGIG
jgi:hypothetical protein